MADCELLEKCIFFNDKMAGMPSMANIYKTRFCKGDFAPCARYRVAKALGREKVPPDLFPNQTERANALLAQK